MAIIVVGNFLRDLKSNYLEGALCILVYLTIAVRIVSAQLDPRKTESVSGRRLLLPQPRGGGWQHLGGCFWRRGRSG